MEIKIKKEHLDELKHASDLMKDGNAAFEKASRMLRCGHESFWEKAIKLYPKIEEGPWKFNAKKMRFEKAD